MDTGKRFLLEDSTTIPCTEIYLFASRINNQLPLYAARSPDRCFSMLADRCFSSELEPVDGVYSCSDSAIAKDSSKNTLRPNNRVSDSPDVVGTALVPSLTRDASGFPAQFPVAETTLYLAFNPQVIHPLWKTLHLAVFPLSGLVYKQQAFHQRCEKSCWHRGGQALKRDMKDPGSCGLAGDLTE